MSTLSDQELKNLEAFVATGLETQSAGKNIQTKLELSSIASILISKVKGMNEAASTEDEAGDPEGEE